MARFTLKFFPSVSGIVDQKASAMACLTPRFQFVGSALQLWLMLTVLLLTHLFSENGFAQGRIIVMEKDLRPVSLPTSEVTWIPGATRKAGPVGKIPWDLSVGDELIGNTGAVAVKVRCNNTTDIVLSGRFDVRFLRAKEKGGCNLHYDRKGGSAINVNAGGPTAIQTGISGEIRLGSRRTRYEVRTPPDQGEVPPEVLVFENEVFVESPGFSGTVKEGEQLVTGGNSHRLIKKLKSLDYRRAAEIFARLDVSQAFRLRPTPPAFRELESAFKELLSRHQAVLEHPHDQAKLIALKKAQQKFGIQDAESSPQPQTTNRQEPSLKVGEKRTVAVPFDNGCSKRIKVRATLGSNTPFARLESKAEAVAGPHATTNWQVRLDATGLRPGTYAAEIALVCLDCPKQKCALTSQVARVSFVVE